MYIIIPLIMLLELKSEFLAGCYDHHRLYITLLINSKPNMYIN